ncbi:MAG: RluA family pseudouridine synthase [Lachnospiraceae bacterium]|nr:RluA family pseudouridine synthase [Lachnospiraceae bacterium]
MAEEIKDDLTIEGEALEPLIGIRLDKALSQWDPSQTRSHYQKMIADGFVLVNHKSTKANYKIAKGDILTLIPMPVQQLTAEAEDIPLDILYEDEDVIIVNKPKGMVVHPAPGHPRGTLVNAIMFHCKDRLSTINGVIRPGIVHRIDQDTTGSLIICKNDNAHNDIAAQIKEHSVNRIYRGIVLGNVKDDKGIVDAPIGRSEKDRKKMAVNARHSRNAVTHYKVLRRYKGYTYMEFKLETGRTHQIRVHMASMGYPLLGDKVYGPAKCPYHLQGQTLHAMTIGFIHPRTKEYIEFQAPLPEYFQHLLDILPS